LAYHLQPAGEKDDAKKTQTDSDFTN